MTQFKNNPNLRNNQNERMVRSYVHQPLTIEHYGLHAQIKENGRVLISGIPVKISDTGDDEKDYEYDQVEVPASFVFKIVNALTLTRSVKLIPFAEAKEKELESLE